MLLKLKKLLTSFLIVGLLVGGRASLVVAEEFVITGNGSSSESSINVTQETDTVVVQNNTEEVQNNVSTASDTGDNSASENTNAENIIDTGDATSRISIENGGNSSITDVGCCSGETETVISKNGADSANIVNTETKSTSTVNTSQITTITNNITGSASTGSNSSNDNSGGDVSIMTGDVNASANIENNVNSDSISIKNPSLSVKSDVSENGSRSANNINGVFVDEVNVYTNASSVVANYLIWDLETGDNQANGNSGGDVVIETGDIDLEVFISNFVNMASVSIDCCYDPRDPGKDDPNLPDETKDGEDEGNGGSDGGGGGSSSDGAGGQILPEAASVSAGGPGIIGLSDTSSDRAKSLLFWIALGLIAVGGKIVTEELFPKSNNTSIKRIRLVEYL